MATYKVIQDVEAEDKILGPLTLRQFVYAGIAVILLYLCYLVFTKGLGFMIVFFLPVAIVFGFFAFPWGRDQPTEIWALAKIRFLFKPRKRIWDQSGVKELVTVTAPKQVEEIIAGHLSQTEVKSRLRALADTIDSRGWAIKNVGVGTFASPFAMQQSTSSDRLLDVSTGATPRTIATDVKAADDMLDETANPNAQRMNSMISASAQAHRQKIIQEMQTPSAPTPPPQQQQQQQQPAADYWFLNQTSPPVSAPRGSVTFSTPQVVAPHAQNDEGSMTNPTANEADEAALVQELEAHKEQGPTSSYYGHLHTIQPISVQKEEAARRAREQRERAALAPPPPPPPPPPAPVTPSQQAAILQLASNNDLNVATLAREAKRTGPDNEVVIKLH